MHRCEYCGRKLDEDNEKDDGLCMECDAILWSVLLLESKMKRSLPDWICHLMCFLNRFGGWFAIFLGFLLCVFALLVLLRVAFAHILGLLVRVCVFSL